MNNETKKKKRNKKNKNADIDVPQQEIIESAPNDKLTIDYKQFVKPELLTATSQLKLKPLIEVLSKAAQLKNDQANATQLYELYRSVQNQKIQSQIEIIQSRIELVLLENDKQTAKEKHDGVLKKAQDKDNYQQMLVDKGNKLQQEKLELMKAENDKRTNLIKEAEEFAQSLQKSQEDSLPERELLLKENTRLRKEIENCLLNSMKIKEEFDKKIKENELKFKEFNIDDKNGINKTMEIITASAQKNVMENAKLKSEITAYEQKTEELKKIIDMADGEYNKIQNEINQKKDESIILASENAEIRSRFKQNKVNLEEIKKLLTQYENERNKLNMMESLNKKYTEQYSKLYEEKYPTPLPEKNEEKTCWHDHEQNNQIEQEGDECHHSSCHEHQNDKQPELQLSNSKFEISNANKFEISNEVDIAQINNTEKELNTNITDNTSQMNKDLKVIEEQVNNIQIESKESEEALNNKSE